MIEEKHVWRRITQYYYICGDLKKHYAIYFYKCEDCGMSISEEEYNKLEDK